MTQEAKTLADKIDAVIKELKWPPCSSAEYVPAIRDSHREMVCTLSDVRRALRAAPSGRDPATIEAATNLRGWAIAYRNNPQFRFPSDPDAEFFPFDLELAASLLDGTFASPTDWQQDKAETSVLPRTTLTEEGPTRPRS
jgi:hypothetical protein